MSGGSMNYIYSSLEDAADQIPDPELKDLTKDLAKVLHDCEWWLSGDISQGSFRKTAAAFKAKWFETYPVDRMRGYVDAACEKLKRDMGLGDYCKDCAKFKPKSDSDYGSCDHYKMCLTHGYDDPCEEFERRT